MAKAQTVTMDRGKFLGDSAGNRNINHNMTQMNIGGSGESHGTVTPTEYCGPTKGNTDVPPDRTTGYVSGKGAGKNKVGGMGY